MNHIMFILAMYMVRICIEICYCDVLFNFLSTPLDTYVNLFNTVHAYTEYINEYCST